jgi:hypothetical protein
MAKEFLTQMLSAIHLYKAVINEENGSRLKTLGGDA